MLRRIYSFATPWAKANKLELVKNKVLSKLTSLFYKIINLKFAPYVKNKNKLNDVIISLTSFPERIPGLYYCLCSLINQTAEPEKIVLWLAESQFPNKDKDLPNRILSLRKYGLEINYCFDSKSYKKILYSASKYKDKCIVTVDDDVLYPEDMLMNLYKQHLNYKSCVVCNRAHKISIENGKVQDYQNWISLSPDVLGPSKSLIAIGVGGVLYPPYFFESVCLDYDIIKSLSPSADDLWLKVIEIQKGVPVVKVVMNTRELFTIIGTQKQRLSIVNVENGNSNDIALEKLMKYYGLTSSDFED